MTVDHVSVHVVGAGLTATSIAGLWGYIPVVVAVLAGLAAIASYTFTVLDSPSFQRLVKRTKDQASNPTPPPAH